MCLLILGVGFALQPIGALFGYFVLPRLMGWQQ